MSAHKVSEKLERSHYITVNYIEQQNVTKQNVQVNTSGIGNLDGLGTSLLTERRSENVKKKNEKRKNPQSVNGPFNKIFFFSFLRN